MSREQSSSSSEIAAAQAVVLSELVTYQAGSVVSRTIIKRPVGTVTLFAFAEGEGLSEHTAAFDALAHVLEGEVEITISGKAVRAKAGQAVLMPAHQPHALRGITPFKMVLTMLRA